MLVAETLVAGALVDGLVVAEAAGADDVLGAEL
jgi:hypothetical protein